MRIFSRAFIKQFWKVIVATFTGFIDDNGLKLSASLAYYTVFSVAPLLILIFSLVSLLLGRDAINNTLYPEIKEYVGSQAAVQIQEIVKDLQFSGKTGAALIIGIIILLVGASSMFIDIQDSINIIWRVKAKPKKEWVKLVQNRFLSFSLIISLGFLLLVSLVINIVLSALSEKLAHFFPGVTILVFSGINLAITLVVIAVLFCIIFKVLPDAKIKWAEARTGAIFTAVLFMIGQYLIGLYIHYTAQGSAYGAAGAIIVILVWIYYSSAILYIGAEFTHVYAAAVGRHIVPADDAVHVRQTEIER
ncbi:MAG TPA: YihY/virulence factor BrkB family protein [Mucilaginibacter sp.]|nr:YihY/virulence factor BrkB family protein [Mucilaginibacter sp.]